MTAFDTFDLIYKIIVSLATLGVFGFMFKMSGMVTKISIRLGEFLQWQKTIDKEVSSHGGMLQQLTAAVNRLIGRAEDGPKSR